MLPSMPLLLLTPSEEFDEPNLSPVEDKESEGDLKTPSDTKDESQEELDLCKISPEKNFFDSVECDDELALLSESSPETEKSRKFLQSAHPRKKRKLDLTANGECDYVSDDERAERLAHSYFMKAKSLLDKDRFEKFISILSEFNDENGNVMDLFKDLMGAVSQCPELAEEFIGFLLPHQALECLRLPDQQLFDKAWKLVSKCDAYHLSRLVHLLEQHVESPNFEGIKNSVLQLLKTHPSLLDSFFQLLPQEKPPQKDNHFEEISSFLLEKSDWETLRISTPSDKGCGTDCSCPCHRATSNPMCVSCNIRFSNGEIYVHDGKKLRFVKISFKGMDCEEVLKKLNPDFYDQCHGRKPRTNRINHQRSSSISEEALQEEPGGDQEEVHFSCDDILEENLDLDYLDLNPLNGDNPFIEYDDKMDTSSNGEDEEEIREIKLEEEASDETDNNETSDETDNNECSNHLESADSLSPLLKTRKETDDTPLSPGLSLPLKIKKDTEDTPLSPEGKSTEPSASEWTRDEDKVILETFQNEVDPESTFSKISGLMPTRSLSDIQERFQVLMKLLEEVTSGSREEI